MITEREARALKIGDVLFHVLHRNSDGTPQRWRVNGQVRTWKRTPERIEIPLKHGLYTYDTLTARTLFCLCLTEEEAKGDDVGI